MPKGKVAKASLSSAKRKKSGRGNGSSGNAVQTILNVTATLATQSSSKPNSVPREKVVAFAKLEGVMAKSTFANGLTALKKAGLITMSAGVITVTDKGVDQAEITDMSHASNDEYHEKIKVQLKLTARACQLFGELADGQVHNKKQVATAIGCKMNSTWANMLTLLKQREVIVFDKETINLTDDMFPLGRPIIE